MTTPRSLTPNFEDDIFISYDHDDDQPAIASYRGWVDTMHESLATRLTQLMGEKPKIWRDTMMRHNVPLETLVLRLSKTAFLVSVLSPSYVKSEWCQRELNEFYDRAALNGGIKINNKSRIFKVVKTPIEDNDPSVDPLRESKLPLELRLLLQDSLGYDFYEIDRSGKLREFLPERGQEFQSKFLDKLEDLARDIKEFIKDQQSLLNEPQPKRSIYLAETTPELSNDRNDIKRTLQLHNYHVLPDENLPVQICADFEQRVKEYLERSILSIHMVGSDHSTVPANQDELSSLDSKHRLAALRVQKQHELAMARSENDQNYSRLIWIPRNLVGQGADYQSFIDYLQNDPGVSENADLLNGDNLENLKTIIQKKLKFSVAAKNDDGRVKRVYLLCDRQDMNAIAPLQASLTTQKYEVLLPFTESGQVAGGHKENLRLCDAVLIFYGSADTMKWKLDYLKRSDVFRDKRPLLAKGIYVAGPESDQKRSFDTNEALVMKNFGEFSLESITPFLKQVEIASKGATA